MYFCIALSFVINLILTPLIIFLSKKYSWYDSINSRKMHTVKVSRLGGVGLIISSLSSLIVYVTFFSAERYTGLLYIFLASLVIFIAGTLDDFLELKAKVKLFFQILAALIVALSPLYFKEFFIFSINEITGRLMTFVWVILVINAYNLIDGIDLLCSGLCFLTHLTLGFLLVFCAKENALICFVIASSLLAFMFFNKSPAKIFLGDSGSQFLGFSISIVPLIYNFSSFEDVKAFVMLVLVAIPVIDVFAAVWRRKRDGRSLFSADRAHIHHKLINIGFSKAKTVCMIFFMQLLASFSVIAGLFMNTFMQRFVFLTVDFMFMLGIFLIVHYVNRAVNSKCKGKLN